MNKLYTGVVEDINDPLKSGRVKVRVFGLHTDDLNLIPTADLPWAQVAKSTESAGISGIGWAPGGLVNGSWVKVTFEDSDHQYPFVLCAVSGISSNPNNKASYEEIAFGTTIEQTKAENPPQKEASEVVTDQCELNTNMDGFYSKFGKDNPNLVLHACCDAGITNPYAKIAILANVAKECEFIPQDEKLNYSVTRARQVFPTKTAPYTDAQLSAILSSPEATGNMLYGGRYGNAKDEGYKYRGRGFIQITFKLNYQQASSDIGVDVVTYPDLLNVPKNAAKSSVKFIIRNCGGLGVLNGFTDQDTANRTVTQTIGGKSLNLNTGTGAQFLSKVTNYSKLGYVVIEPTGTEPKKATPIGNKDADGTISDGLSPQNRSVISNSGVGFKDPTGKYPLQKFINEPDTNRLTRNNTELGSFETKKKQRRTGIKNVGGDFEQPKAPYNPKYPYNRGYFSESGHVLAFDDTEKQERLDIFHRSGTFTEIDNFGNRVNKIIGSDYTIIEKNGYLYIDGTMRMTVSSTANITINGNVNMSVDGNYNLDVGGTFDLKVAGDINIASATSVNLSATTNTMINAGEVVGIDAYMINLNSGVSSSLPNTTSRDPVEKDYSEQLGESVEEGEMISNDDASSGETDAFLSAQIAEGKITKDELDKGAATKAEETDIEKPTSRIEALPGNCAVFEGRDKIPGDTVISKSFTLADLTTKVALPSERREVSPNAGLTVSQIVCNLKKLAENCLDPIKAQFPDMIITNTIRKNGNKSQHESGFAADTQYTTAAPKDYYEIAKWIKDNVIFDQLLLEYRTNGRPWIHISYTDNPRRQVLTLMNHKTHTQGLAQLG